MRKVMFGGLLAAIAAAVVILTAGGGNEAQAGTPVDIAVDLDPTGNTATSVGTIQNTMDNVALNIPFMANVTVMGVPSPGLFGVGFEIVYDPAVVSVTGVQPFALIGQVLQYSGGGESPFGQLNASPGSLRVDAVDLSGTDETGDGVVYIFDIECIATGVSTIELTDTSTGGGANAAMLDAIGPFPVNSETEGIVGCGVPATVPATATPTPTVTDPPTATTPAATTPAATTPAATTPAATTPAATTPAATTPAATTPAATTAPTGTAGAGTGAPSATATPGSLPPTGGTSGSTGISGLLLITVIGAALVLAAGGSLVLARSPRKE